MKLDFKRFLGCFLIFVSGLGAFVEAHDSDGMIHVYGAIAKISGVMTMVLSIVMYISRNGGGNSGPRQ